MISSLLVILAFAVMGASDLAKMRGRAARGNVLFLAGMITLAAAGLLSALGGARFHLALALRIVFFALAALGLWGEYSALFVSLPAGDTYLGAKAPGQLVDSGLYALCRHPGGLFLPLMSISLALALTSRSLLIDSLLASLLNLLYIRFQDRVVFPQTIPGYDSYRQRVPFLVPTAQSIARAAAGSKNKQEDV